MVQIAKGSLMNLIPLQQWVCDECGELIEKPEDGWLEWLSSVSHNIPAMGFRIVHHKLASPRGSCYYNDSNKDVNPVFISDGHLDFYLGLNGLATLLTFFLDDKFKAGNPGEVAEIIRRLHLPHYEEARRYFHAAKADDYTYGLNYLAIHSQETLRNIIKEYSEDEK